jgi:hypothetical protein
MNNRIALLIACIAQLPAIAKADDAVWINQLIRDVIRDTPPGQTAEVNLPARTLIIETPISTPTGARNVHIRGVRNRTKIVVAAPITGLIRLNSEANNVGGVWGGDPFLLYSSFYPASKGDRQLRLEPGQPWPMPEAYVTVADAQRDFTGQVPLHAQIVRIVSFDPYTRTCTLDRPLSRDLSIMPIMAHADRRIATNIQLSDLSIDGATGLEDCERGVWAALCDGLTISRVSTTKFLTDNFRMDVCSNATIDDADASYYRGGDTAGQGRGIALFHCDGVRVVNSRLNHLRHGVVISCSTNVAIDDCVANDMLGHGFDTHGLLSEGIRIQNCLGQASLQVGNGTFWQGDKGATIEDTQVSAVYAVGGVSDLTFRRVNASRLNLQSWGDPSQDLRPKRLYFEGCTFELGDGGMPVSLSGGSWRSVESATFVDCTFVQTSPLGGKRCVLMEELSDDVTLRFIRCRFQTASWTRCLELNGDAVIHLELNDCQWQTSYDTMVLLGPNLTGVVRVGRNTFPQGARLLDAPKSVRVLGLDTSDH